MQCYWLEQTLSDVPGHDRWLGNQELSLLNTKRFEKRRTDWRLGRWTAKCAAAAYCDISPQLFPVLEIVPDVSGAPSAMLRGRPIHVALSLSHRDGVGTCVVSEDAAEIGCDIELIEAHSDIFVDQYLADPEKAWIEQTPGQLRPLAVTLLWSGKESVLKAMRQGLRMSTTKVIVNVRDPLPDPSSLGIDRGTPRWHRISATYDGSKLFHGGWFVTGNLVRTIVGPEQLSFPPLPLLRRA